MIDRDRFFAKARVSPFTGKMTEQQVNGCNAIIDRWEQEPKDIRWLAYMLATTKWETAHTMHPVEEIGRGKGLAYGIPVNGKVYYGRGYVQLTWAVNYARMGAVLGVDLTNHPELALEPKIAADIMFYGMEHGSFTGVGLPRYFNATVDDPVNARRVINGTDKAEQIEAIHRAFLEALT